MIQWLFAWNAVTLILQKLHALGMSHKLPSEVSINALWPKGHFQNWCFSLYGLQSQKLQVAAGMSQELTFIALFLLQKRWMSSRASPKTQGASTGPEKRLGHGLDTSCGSVGPSLQEHSLRIALFCVAWCTMWSHACNCRYHLIHSQLLLLYSFQLLWLLYSQLLSATATHSYLL